MPIEIRLPRIAEGMTSGRVAVWLKSAGEPVKAGEIVAEIETDKTSVELESPSTGVLGAILVPAGAEDIPVGALLAIVDDEPAEARSGPASVAVAPEMTRDLDAPSRSEPDRRERAGDTADIDPARPADAFPPPGADLDIPATPLARRMAAAAGLDLSRIPYSGDSVQRADVERAIGLRGTPAGPREYAGPRTRDLPPGRDVRLTAARRVGAERLQRAKQAIPHFYLEIECAADALLARRAELNARPGSIALTVTDLLVHAAARALRDVPAAHAAWIGPAEGIRMFEHADIAVAVNTQAGLVTPVVRRADELTLDEVAACLHALAERARAGSLAPGEYAGGTFTISNLGMYGVRSLYPIVNAPQGAILGAGAIVPRAVVREGAVVAAAVFTCTLAADHRALDGATGAEFLAAFKRRIEAPGE